MSAAVEPVDEALLCAWVAEAAPGDMLEYHRGFLGIDRIPFGTPDAVHRCAALARTGDRALALEARGFVHLVQRRLGPERFSYLVVARPRRAKSASFATLMGTEAA